MGKLDNKVAIITGGNAGVGKEIAKLFASEGAKVVISARRQQVLEEAAKEIEAAGGTVLCVPTDISKVDDVKNLVSKTVETFGQLDILINNAGIRGGHIATVTEADYDMILDTNLKAVFFLSRLVGKYMKDNKITGNILNIISSSGLRPATSAYTLSKWGVRGLTLGLAKSLIPYDIVVNGLAPGPTATPMLMKDGSEEIGHTSNPLGRYAMPEEIANMAVVLTSGMGRTVVGDIVYMTGGAGIITFDDMDYKF